MSYQISLPRTTFMQICQNSNKENKKRAKKLAGDWTAEFNNQMTAIEKSEFKIRSITARVNEDAKKNNCNYFTSNLVCRHHNCPTKYTITLQTLTNSDYLSFQVKRTNEHVHQHIDQIRGDERKDVANIVKSEFNGSSKAFVEKAVVCDMSWATVHASLFVLNSETWFDYMTKLYKVSKGETKIEDYDCSWLASCAAHTMNRYGFKNYNIIITSN